MQRILCAVAIAAGLLCAGPLAQAGTVTPPTGQKVTWSGGFYFRVRFLQDSADFENFIGHLWAAKKIEMQSVKL